MLTEFITAVQEGRELTRADITRVVALLADAAPPVEDKASFLASLAAKGETTSEIAGFADELRRMSVPLPWDPSEAGGEVLDVCGTGGDRLDTFNISTTVALVCAASGVTVAKHGNRAVTSKSGSADVLEALGIPVDLTPDAAARSLREQALPLGFRAQGAALNGLAVGQPVRVFVQTRQKVKGIPVPVASLMKSPANQTVVWVKTAPERFEPRTVTTEPLDGLNVAVTSGLKAGDRVATQGATLINQVR